MYKHKIFLYRKPHKLYAHMIQSNVWYLLQNIEILYIRLSKSYHLNDMQLFYLEISLYYLRPYSYGDEYASCDMNQKRKL